MSRKKSNNRNQTSESRNLEESASNVSPADHEGGALPNEAHDLTTGIQIAKQNIDPLSHSNKNEFKSNRIAYQRNQLAESRLKADLKTARIQLAYIEEKPIRFVFKKLTFNFLRALRHRLPLPESFKQYISIKLLPIAAVLQNHNLPKPEYIPLKSIPEIDFQFEETINPQVSIIIPVFNEVAQTVACLRSVFAQSTNLEYEVILADDCSTAADNTVFHTIPGLKVFRNVENMGFLRNCNENSKHARGDYIVFLNNDTLVEPGWLDALFQTFRDHENVGAVGSKLIYPNGELQEAGGIIWRDGSGWNWGNRKNVDHPRYNYVREVDYVSGASLMVRADLWRELGGFSKQYQNAYYEDTDFCFRIRSKGYKVLYQPFSEVVHIEGLSSSGNETQGMKRFQEVNREIFKDTWAQELIHRPENGENPQQASDRYVKGHILYIDAVTPVADRDSGSEDAINAMRILTNMGYRIHFVPGSNFAHWGSATQKLQNLGVNCVYHPFYSNLQSLLNEQECKFDIAIISRLESAEKFMDLVIKECPHTKVVFNTVDLSHLRLQRRAELDGDEGLEITARQQEEKEISFIHQSDASIIISDFEKELLVNHGVPASKLWTIPLIRPKTQRLASFADSKDIAFIGGYNHPPNIDAVKWLIQDLWPMIKTAVPQARLHLCGHNMPEEFKEYASGDVVVRGYIDDLPGFLSKFRLTVAPLRYGAGLKGKVASSIGYGVPCVGTDIAFEGMATQGLKSIKFTANSPIEFADQVAKLYLNEKAWTKASVAGVKYHNRNYSLESVKSIYEGLISSLI